MGTIQAPPTTDKLLFAPRRSQFSFKTHLSLILLLPRRTGPAGPLITPLSPCWEQQVQFPVRHSRFRRLDVSRGRGFSKGVQINRKRDVTMEGAFKMLGGCEGLRREASERRRKFGFVMCRRGVFNCVVLCCLLGSFNNQKTGLSGCRKQLKHKVICQLIYC